MRLTIDEYSKYFKMSKEMIHSKLRQKRLNYIIENGTTYIIVTRSAEELKPKEPQAPSAAASSQNPPRPKPTVATVLALYQRENRQLKERILQLEAKIDKLIHDKEMMLREERERIEGVYAKKDEQLKNILELINTKLMLESPKEPTIHDVESYEQTHEQRFNAPQQRIVELKEYLKGLDLEQYQRKAIKRRFLEAYDNDVRILQQNGKLYLDFSKYDYSDLLALE
ncbi:MAG: hypothetical protein IE916_04125 [Epsilonproteobacteria bacterium]|nr:hypothetical protein [Campylobacterota bacterium]